MKIKMIYQVWYIRVIIKVLKNVKNMVELAVEFEKSNWLQSRCKLIEIKRML